MSSRDTRKYIAFFKLARDIGLKPTPMYECVDTGYLRLDDRSKKTFRWVGYHILEHDYINFFYDEQSGFFRLTKESIILEIYFPEIRYKIDITVINLEEFF